MASLVHWGHLWGPCRGSWRQGHPSGALSLSAARHVSYLDLLELPAGCLLCSTFPPQTGGQTGRQTGRQTDRQAGGQAGRQTGRQGHRHSTVEPTELVSSLASLPLAAQGSGWDESLCNTTTTNPPTTAAPRDSVSVEQVAGLACGRAGLCYVHHFC